MTEANPRRYFFGDYALTYTAEGWALLHNKTGLVGTDQEPSEIDVPYREGKTLLEFVKDAVERGLGEDL